MENINDLQDLLLELVEDIQAAEKQMQKAMPGIVEKVHHRSLKNALLHHHQLTDNQLKRLKTISNALQQGSGKIKEDRVCKGMAGLIEDAMDLLHKQIDKDVTDAAIIFCVQKMEHFEICAYGTALAYAQQLNKHDIAVMLEETLDEEYDVDDLLTALATASLNKEAAPEGIDATEDNHAEDAISQHEGTHASKVSINERTIQSPGGRAGRSHRGYSNGESRGH